MSEVKELNKNDVPIMLPIKEVSARTGLSYYGLRKKCLTGEIVCVRMGNKFFINWDRLIDTLNGKGS